MPRCCKNYAVVNALQKNLNLTLKYFELIAVQHFLHFTCEDRNTDLQLSSSSFVLDSSEAGLSIAKEFMYTEITIKS